MVWVIAYLFFGCSKPLPPEEGHKYLRAFDNEMIQLASRIGKTEAFGALIQLAELPNPPIPFMSENGINGYDFNGKKGYYHFNTATGAFEKHWQYNDEVELIYPFNSKHDSLVVFTLSDYSETKTALQMIFPQQQEAKIKAGNKTLFTANLSATFEHDFPAEMEVEILFATFRISILLHTSFRRSNAILNIKFDLEESGEKKFNTTLSAKVTNSNNTLKYSDVKFIMTAFPIRINYHSSEDFSNSGAEHFIEAFNNNTKVYIATPDDKKIGQVFLAQVYGRDRLNPMIRYHDGTVEHLEDMLFTLRKLLNMKMFIIDGNTGT